MSPVEQRMVEALEKIAAFCPRELSTNTRDRAVDAAWNRAGQYAAQIARAALASAQAAK